MTQIASPPASPDSKENFTATAASRHGAHDDEAVIAPAVDVEWPMDCDPVPDRTC
jgi:hypothetical protein